MKRGLSSHDKVVDGVEKLNESVEEGDAMDKEEKGADGIQFDFFELLHCQVFNF